ncbi:MAG TPA: hypothetical protein VHR66_18315 [Gemmataceae bacterium]|jgi:hypothetical protein|nr:hypothetical protein [Gemmataceae bacterium]
MILNAYSVLDASLTLLRLLLALAVVAIGLSVMKQRRRLASDELTPVENRQYLLFLVAGLLVVLNVLSWPLLYLLLESYVPEWPGVMCIYGVTQIGVGSDGPAGYLPRLLQIVQILKAALVFASGAWAVLYLANRRTRSAPLTGRVVWTTIIVGVLASVDAAGEAAYLAIPKKEEAPSVGCCVTPVGDQSRFLPHGIAGELNNSWLHVAYYGANAAVILGLLVTIRMNAAHKPVPRLAPLGLLALVNAAATTTFLIDVAAPAILHLPYHHCLYDLVPRAPESLLAVAAFVFATFAIGWACATAWGARCAETEPFLGEQIRMTLVAALFAYVGSIAMVSIEVAVS